MGTQGSAAAVTLGEMLKPKIKLRNDLRAEFRRKVMAMRESIRILLPFVESDNDDAMRRYLEMSTSDRVLELARMRCGLQDMSVAYRQRLRDLDTEIEEAAAESDQTLLKLGV